MKTAYYNNGRMEYRDMTNAENEQYNSEQDAMPDPEPTLEEQFADLVDLVSVLVEVIADD